MNSKIGILDKQSDWQEQYARCNCILLHGIPNCKGEVANDVAAKAICENINDNLITLDDTNRSHRIGKYDP